MHELSIAQSIMTTVFQEMKRRNITCVKSIGVKIGTLSGVMLEALQFSYEAITRDTPLSDTALIIEHVPLLAECNLCGKQFKVENIAFFCPACHSVDVTLLQGEELDITYLEIEDADLNDR